jgi:glucose/arabinose dehydrogenase
MLLPFIAFILSMPQSLPAHASRPSGVVPGFTIEPIVGDLDLPTTFAFLPDGRILIAEKAGRVKIWKDGVLYARPLTDIRDEVNEFIDRGLIGMAVDPAFERNGYVYLLYSWDAPGQAKDADEPRRSRLVRYTVQGDVVRPNSGVVLLDDHWTDTQNHSVGALKFALDGSLFVSLGDGSLSAMPDKLSLRAQDIDNVQGKILHIDPKTGNGLPGNPFFDPKQPKSARSRVWSYGYRNPFRFALHPQTNIPYVGDVGWNTYESLMRATPGSNFGWPCVEGVRDVPEFQKDPVCKNVNAKTTDQKVVVYPHEGNNASITVGDFNFSDNFPADMRGDLFFGDYSKRFIRRAMLDENGKVKQVIDFADDVGEPVDIQFGPDGALYWLSIYSGGLRRIYDPNKPLGSLAQITQTAVSDRPTVTITSPADGDTILPGVRVAVRGEAANADKLSWRVTWYEGRRGTVLTETLGAQTEFIMPEGISDKGFVEVILSATNNRGELAVARINLYSQPGDAYIRSWWLIGGFPWRTLNDDVAPGGEANYTLKPGDKLAQLIRSPSLKIDLSKYITPARKNVAYAFVWLDSPEERKGFLGMNSDDGIAAWLNGKEIWRNRISRYVPEDTRDIDLPPITLKKGLNALLIKVDQNDGEWAFKARVLNPDGSIMRDVVAKTGTP